MSAVSPDSLALQRFYHWERTAPQRVCLTQPTGGGAVRDYTWRSEERRVGKECCR